MMKEYRKINELEYRYLNSLLDKEILLEESLSELLTNLKQKLQFFKRDKEKFSKIPKQLMPIVFFSPINENDETDDIMEKIKGFYSKVFPGIPFSSLKLGKTNIFNLDLGLNNIKALDNIFSNIGISLNDDSTKYYILINSILLNLEPKEIEKLEIKDLNHINLKEQVQVAIAPIIAELSGVLSRSLPIILNELRPVLVSLLRSGAINNFLKNIFGKIKISGKNIESSKVSTRLINLLKHPIISKIFIDFLVKFSKGEKINLEDIENEFINYLNNKYPINFSLFTRLPNALDLELNLLKELDDEFYKFLGIKNLVNNDLIKIYLSKKALIKRIPISVVEKEFTSIAKKALDLYKKSLKEVTVNNENKEENDENG